jgi:hypothetical protein
MLNGRPAVRLAQGISGVGGSCVCRRMAYDGQQSVQRMNQGSQQPTRDEFLAYWSKGERNRGSCRSLLPHAIYISGLALYAAIVRYLDPTGRFGFACVAIAIVYIIAVPWVWIVTAQKRNARFIRCPQCGDWLGRDTSGAWFGPNPNWRLIGQTGKCTKCGKQLLAEG